MKISNRIFNILQEKNISQQDFAEKTGISPSVISDWKRKGTNPSADKIITICRVLEVSPNYLLNENIDLDSFEEGYYSSPLELELLNIFRGLKPDLKNRLIGYAQAISDMQNEEN
ncbi:MAG: helix-turn-helix transcriptional regulator [Firmicutes bacterium]|nr:helix-turn-helix transcriptional regulator [Bacillota bacterium]